MRTALAFMIVACLVPRAAHAGRSFYGWLYGTEVLPERGVELQTWLFETNGRYGNAPRTTSLWWGPLIGVTDQLELSLPVEMAWVAGDDTSGPSFSFRRYGLEARYRLVTSDPVAAPALVPLVRAAIKRDVSDSHALLVEGDVVASYDVGAVNALVDVGVYGDLKSNNRKWNVRPGAGVSIAVTGELRLGAEAYVELDLDSSSDSWAVVGPNLAWTHGRFWLSGSFGIGVYHIDTAPRVMWGIAF